MARVAIESPVGRLYRRDLVKRIREPNRPGATPRRCPPARETLWPGSCRKHSPFWSWPQRPRGPEFEKTRKAAVRSQPKHAPPVSAFFFAGFGRGAGVVRHDPGAVGAPQRQAQLLAGAAPQRGAGPEPAVLEVGLPPRKSSKTVSTSADPLQRARRTKGGGHHHC